MRGDYRIFVGAFPEGELAARIQALRVRHDPVTARITPPHVTLAGTYWRTGPATAENERAAIASLAALAGRLTRFALVLEDVRQFAGTTTLYLAVVPTPELMRTRKALLTALGSDRHWSRFTPHLTLTMRLAPEPTRLLLVELLAGKWGQGRREAPIDGLQLMQRGPADAAWRCIYRLPLAA